MKSNTLNKNDKVLYIAKGYINTEKDKELENILFVKDNLSDDILAKIWQNYNFDKAEKRVFELQCYLTKATFSHDLSKMRRYQDKIVHSTEAKMLSIRKVSEISKSKARNRWDNMEKRLRKNESCNKLK